LAMISMSDARRRKHNPTIDHACLDSCIKAYPPSAAQTAECNSLCTNTRRRANSISEESDQDDDEEVERRELNSESEQQDDEEEAEVERRKNDVFRRFLHHRARNTVKCSEHNTVCSLHYPCCTGKGLTCTNQKLSMGHTHAIGYCCVAGESSNIDLGKAGSCKKSG